jgi:hypothetical protein
MITVRLRSVMWCIAGIAIALSLVWSLTAWNASAAPGSDESTFVPVTPTRIMDTRDPTNVGLAGPFVSPVSQRLQVTGTIPTTSGRQLVVPPGSNGVVLNVTVVNAMANGFVSIRPGDAVGQPTTSSLNFVAGQIVANAVDVPVPTSGARAGTIDITFDALGTPGPTVDIVIDIVGYHTASGLQQLVADVARKANIGDLAGKANIEDLAGKASVNDLARKANAADVHTKEDVDAKFATKGLLTIGAGSFTADSDVVDWNNGCARQEAPPFTVRASVSLPVGVTIQTITGFLLDGDQATNTTLELRRVRSNDVEAALAVATSDGFGLGNFSADLATPVLVEQGDHFNVEMVAPNALHQICGASITYTIPPGQSLL